MCICISFGSENFNCVYQQIMSSSFGGGDGWCQKEEGICMKQKPLLVLEGRWSVTHRVLGARRPPLQEKTLSLQVCCQRCWQGSAPFLPCAVQYLIGKASSSQPSNTQAGHPHLNTHMLSFTNSCIEIEFIYHTIHPFKVYNSMAFSIFRVEQPSPQSI